MDTSEEGWRQPLKAVCTGSVKGSKVGWRGKVGTAGGSIDPIFGTEAVALDNEVVRRGE
jgi:hypothetical protein